VAVRELNQCPVCGNTEATEFDIGPDHRLRRCSLCETVYALRHADPEDIFVDGYLTGGGQFGIDVTRPHFARVLRAVTHRRLGLLERVAKPPGRLLDVGCGTGDFLVTARSRGWQVTGVEPVPASARVARETRCLNVVTATLDVCGLPERSFDVVTALHVLEHMDDPVSFVTLMSRWVAPGGVLFVEVPNFKSFCRLQAGEGWPLLHPLDHVVHFSPATLDRVLRCAGVRPVLRRTPTYLVHFQALDQMLFNLGWSRWRAAFAPLGATEETEEGPLTVPRTPVWAVLRAADRLYDFAHVGMFIVVAATVP
jgi:SAM-dependent methyltransferase